MRVSSCEERTPLNHRLRSNDITLSFAQQRLWFLDRLEPHTATYNIPSAIRLSGNLNVTALEQSVNTVIDRHESLRTVFRDVNDAPMQTILPSFVISLPCLDLRDHSESERELALQRQLRAEAERPFDLACGPLIRSQLWRLTPHEHVFLLNLHHIVSDGWSMEVLLREIFVVYQAHCSGEPPLLAELPIQYADYVF